MACKQCGDSTFLPETDCSTPENCSEFETTECVIYTGPAIDSLNINTGDRLSVVLKKLLEVATNFQPCLTTTTTLPTTTTLFPTTTTTSTILPTTTTTILPTTTLLPTTLTTTFLVPFTSTTTLIPTTSTTTIVPTTTTTTEIPTTTTTINQFIGIVYQIDNSSGALMRLIIRVNQVEVLNETSYSNLNSSIGNWAVGSNVDVELSTESTDIGTKPNVDVQMRIQSGNYDNTKSKSSVNGSVVIVDSFTLEVTSGSGNASIIGGGSQF